jgi:CDP-L-myo-inositol myo-inositolphosphotransferase
MVPAVILAAGRGQRLREGSEGLLKPLTPLLGLTLLERAILSCREVGVTECYVVVGYGKEQIFPHMETLALRHGICIRGVDNPHWEEGNGTSALAVKPFLNGPFLLLMCDHVFDPAILQDLIAAGKQSETCLLAVDGRSQHIFDLADATKVQLHGQAITAIGKELTVFDAIDTGLFLCRPPVFKALEQARADGDSSLTGGMRRLIAGGHLRAVGIGDRFWCDIDTPQCLEYAERMLLAGLAKPHGDGVVSRYINRFISRWMSRYLARTPLTPNMLTVLSLLICLAGALLFSLGDYLWTLVAGVLTQLAAIVDGCDGEIARLKYKTSRFGAWCDTVLDRYADTAIVAGIAYGYARTHPPEFALLGSILALSGVFLFSYSRKEYHLRYGHDLPTYLRYTVVWASRDVRLFVVFFGALLAYPFEALLLTSVLAHAAVGWRVLTVYRRDTHTAQPSYPERTSEKWGPAIETQTLAPPPLPSGKPPQATA